MPLMGAEDGEVESPLRKRFPDGFPHFYASCDSPVKGSSSVRSSAANATIGRSHQPLSRQSAVRFRTRNRLFRTPRRYEYTPFKSEDFTDYADGTSSVVFTGADSPMTNHMLSVMGAFAGFERSLITERQKEGIALAKQRGADKGGKRRSPRNGRPSW